MKQRSYRENDYSFGQTMLTLRSAIGMTQAGMAEMLGISRQSVAEWEAGSKYPKAKHLQAFVALAIQHQAFPSGGEVDIIRELWKASRQKILLDESWLAQLLAWQPEKPHAATTSGTHLHGTHLHGTHLHGTHLHGTRLHWQDALTLENFYGRERELQLLTDWVVKEQCRVVTLLGFGGIGKSSMAVHLMHQVAENFAVVIWRSLRDLPKCDELLISLLQALVPQALGATTDSFEQRLSLLMEQLRTTHVLVVLDNVESVLEADETTGRPRPGYEDFGRFLAQIATTRHQSTILLTSRQKPDALLPHEGAHTPVRTLRLSALNNEACEQLLVEKEVVGNSVDRLRLIQSYAGNPLALKIVAQTIVDLFGGEIALFLEQEGVILGGVRELLHAQYQRLSPLAKRIAFWLAILREPVSLRQLQAFFHTPLPPAIALDTLNHLYRHSLIEQGQVPGTFTLQSVVLEYLTEQIVAESCDEILRGELVMLLQHGLEQSRVKEYVRRTQTRLLIAPLLLRLQTMGQQDLETQIKTLLDTLRASPAPTQGYGPATLIALLREMRGHLRASDLSHLLIRGATLQAVEMQDSNLADATIHDSIFTDSFEALQSLSISSNGEYWATGGVNGEIRIYEAASHTLYRLWPMTRASRIALSPDGRFLAGRTDDGEILLWEIANSSLLWSSGRDNSLGFVPQLAFSPDGRILAFASDVGVHLWEPTQGKLLTTLPHPKAVPCIVWRSDGCVIVSGDAAGTIRLWTIHPNASAELLMTIEGHGSVVTGVAFSPTGDRLASGSWDGLVKIWNSADGSLQETVAEHREWIQRLSWSADGQFIAYSVRNEASWLWDVKQHRHHSALRGHKTFVRGLHFMPDSRQLISASQDGTIRIWDTTTGACIHIMVGYAGKGTGMEWSPDGTRMLVANLYDLFLTVYALKDGSPIMTLGGLKDSSPGLAWFSGDLIACHSSDNEIRLWNGETGEVVESLRYPSGSENGFNAMDWSPDGRTLAVAMMTHGFHLVDMTTRAMLPLGDGQRLSSRTHIIIEWSPNGKMLAVVCYDTTIEVWDVASGLPLLRAPGEHWCFAWRADSAQLGIVESHGDDYEFVIWNILRGERTPLFKLPGKAHYVAWTKDSKFLIAACDDGWLRWWDVESGDCIRQVYSGNIFTMRLSPDRTQVATSDDEGVILIFDVHTGEKLMQLRRDRPYERMNIAGIRGVTEAQKATLLALGAIEKGIEKSFA